MTTRAAKSTIPAFAIIPFLLLTLLAANSCQHIGPRTIVDDRLAYNKNILTSWEQQTLLNVVRVRYDDLVGFVDVSGVTQTHTRQDSISATLMASLLPWHIHKDTISPSLTGGRMMTDSPAITYTPLTGSDFVKNLNAPIKPTDILNLIESDYKTYALLNLTLYSINGLKNDPQDPTSEKFGELTEALDCAHARGDLNFYVQPAADDAPAKVFMIIADEDCKTCGDKCPEVKVQYGSGRYATLPQTIPPSPVSFIRSELHLRAAATKFEIVQGSRPRQEDEIAMRTRSVIAAMRWLSQYVTAPPKDIDYFNLKPNVTVANPPLKVMWSPERPHGTFARVYYKNLWFSIDETDPRSKFSLIYLRTLLAIADTSAKPSPPVLTIPTR